MTKRKENVCPVGNATIDLKPGSLLRIYDIWHKPLGKWEIRGIWHAVFMGYGVSRDKIMLRLKTSEQSNATMLIKAFNNKRRFWEITTSLDKREKYS
jgi:hypothetical protein